MNVFDLDRLGERIHQLDRDDELYNCTGQLVATTLALTSALSAVADSQKGSEEERVAILLALACGVEVRGALKPFEPTATPMTKWRLIGWDTFEGAEYPLTEHDDEEACVKAARERLRVLEQSQPTSSSGGQDGIQDRVFIESPDGVRYRFREAPPKIP